VYLNGVHLSPADVTATNGSDVVLVACLVNDIVDVVSYSPFEVAGATFTGTTTTDVSLTTGVLTANGGAVFNEGSADVDFRVETNGQANMFFIDGGNDAVGIKTNAPATNGQFSVRGAIATTNFGNVSGDFSDATTGSLKISHASGVVKLITDQTLSLLVGTSVVAMGIDATGAVTKPLQPAFSAKVNSQINNMTVGGSSNTTIPFATEIFDQNADYNTNGTFTAPVTGKYSLSFFIRLESIDTATTSYDFAINTGNRNYTHRFDPDFGDSDTIYYHVNLTVLADMDAGDTAHVEYYITAGTAQTDIDPDSYFMGHLVC